MVCLSMFALGSRRGTPQKSCGGKPTHQARLRKGGEGGEGVKGKPKISLIWYLKWCGPLLVLVT
jgi:hypothetical protein